MPMSLVHYHHPAAHTSTVEDITADDITAARSAATPQPSLTLEDTERETIRRSLENNGGRRKATARELNISERTLYRKIKEYGLE